LRAEGNAVAVVIARLDRFGRHLKESVAVRDELRELQVATHVVKEGGEITDIAANILSSVAQEEVRRLGERVSEVREALEAKGWHLPGRAAWGYRVRPATREERDQGAPLSVIEPDPATAPYVHELFRRVAVREATPRGAALWVATLSDEARGLTTVVERDGNGGDDARTTVKVVRPRTLTPSHVRQILRNCTYAGRFPDGSPGRWPALIDAATWDAVQAVMDARRMVRGPVSGNHLLTSMLRCPACDGRMAGQMVARKYPRYRCSSNVLGGALTRRDCKETCAAPAIDREVLARTAALITPVATGDAALRAAIAREWERTRRPNEAARRDRQRALMQAERDRDEAKRLIAHAARLLVDGTLDKLGYDELTTEQRRRLAETERVLDEASDAAPAATLPPLSEVLAQVGGWTTVLSTGPIPEQRAVLMMLVERVVPRRLSYGRYTAEITWTDLGKALQEMPVAA